MKTFEKTLTVVSDDLDELDHVNNVRYVQWIQDISKEHWLQQGKEEARILRKNLPDHSFTSPMVGHKQINN